MNPADFTFKVKIKKEKMHQNYNNTDDLTDAIIPLMPIKKISFFGSL